MHYSMKKGRSVKLIKHEEGTSKNNRKQKRKHVEVMDSSSLSVSLNNQSDSWDCPPSYRKHVIPDSTMIPSRRASLRSAKKLTKSEMPSVSRCSHHQKSREHSSTTAVFQQHDDPVDTIAISEYQNQAPAGSLESPPRHLSLVANPSTFSPEMRHEMSEKVGNFAAPERFTADIPEVKKVHVAEISMPMPNTQMEGQQPLAADIFQTSNNFEERANKNRRNSVSGVGFLSASSSLNLTEMINLWNDEDDEINSVGQSQPMDTVDKYQVKPESMPILRKILRNQGDIAKNCTVVTMKCRSMLLEMICDIIKELQDKDLSEIREDGLQDMVALVIEIKNKNVDIEWLHQRLVEILEARQVLKQSGMLKERKVRNRKTIENVERELKEYEEEEKAMAIILQSIYDKKTICKEVLARARDESTMITATVADAKSKVQRFLNCSLVDGLSALV